jgi:hypothetical protein
MFTRKITISFVMSVCRSVRFKQLGFHWTNFREISLLSIFFFFVENIKVSLKSDKYNSTLYADQFTFSFCLATFFLEWEIFQIKFVEKITTYILHPATIFRKSCRLRDNVEKYCRGGQVIESNTMHKHCMLDT